MKCFLYIQTEKGISEFRDKLIAFLGVNKTTAEIFDLTTLKNPEQFLPLYFYGKTNQTANFLFASDNEHQLRIFIEGFKTDNLDQLVTETNHIFNNVKGFLKKNEISFSKVNATIWSEEDEILRGEYKSFWKRFKSNLPDLPTGIYLVVLNILYSAFQPKGDGSETTIENAMISIGINTGITASAVIFWLFIKAGKDSEISFKIK